MAALKINTFSLPEAFRRLRASVPLGGSLPEEVWRQRHRFLLGLTWFHAVIIALVGPVLGYKWELSVDAFFDDGTVAHTVGEGLVVALFAVAARWKRGSRTLRATAVGFGLMSSSAILVHLSGGYIELHFHFFVMLVFLALYQNWAPYLMSIVYVAIHHGVVGALWPEEVFNHTAALNAPWTWAGIHAFFVLWSCVGSVVAWRLNERAFAQTKLILDSAGEGIYGVDPDGKATFVNSEAARMLGYTIEELIGRNMHDVVHHSRADGTPYPLEECPIYAALKHGTVRRVTEEVLWRKDGTSFPADYVSTPIFERGELSGAVVTFRDVTHRTEAVKALRESEERFRQIAENIKEVFWVTDPVKDGWIYISPAYREIWGRSPDALGPMLLNWLGAVHAEDLGRVLAAVVTKQVEGRYDEEYRIVRPDGSMRWIRDRAFPIRNHLGRIYRITGIAEDVTKRRQAEEEAKLRAREQQALNAIATAISQSLRLNELLEIALDKVIEITGRERASIRLKDPVTGKVTLAAHRGFSQEEVSDLLRRVPHQISDQVFASGKPVVINSRVEAPASQSLLPQSSSVAWTPMTTRTRVVGVLGVSAGRPVPFSSREIEFLQAVGNVIGMALENAQLFEESQGRNRELQALYTVSNKISRSLDIETLMQAALKTTIDVLGVDAGRLYVLDEKSQVLRLAAHHGLPVDQVSGIERYAPGEGIIGRTFTENRPMVFSDMASDPNYAALARAGMGRGWGFRSAAGLPITIKERPVGVIYLYGRTVREFTSQDIDVLSAIGGQIGFAIENARLFQETQRNLERMRALQEIDQAITSSLDLRQVLDVLLEKIDLLLPNSATTVRLFNNESGLMEPVACRNIDEKEWRAEQWKGGRGIAGMAFGRKSVWKVRNVQTDPIVRDPEFFRRHGLVSYLGVPLIVKEKILGVLGFYTKGEHEFGDDEVEFLSALAGQAAIAIHNSRLYEETERRRREAEELARVAQSLTESLDMTAVGGRIVTSVRELFGVKASTLRLLLPDGSLRALASSGEGFSQDSAGDILPTGTGLVSLAVTEGRPIWSADVLNEPKIHLTDQMRDYQLRSGNRSMIAVLLRAHEKIIGALGLADQTGRIYSDSEVALLQTFADQAALVLENARLYEEAQTREAQLQETNRMLSALHAVAAAASQSLDLDRVLQAAIEKVTEIFHFYATQIHIYDEQTDELLLKAYFASDASPFAAVQSFRKGQGVVGKVAESGKPLIFEDVQTDPLYQRLSQSKVSGRLNYHFFTVFPIRGKLKNFGTLACTGVSPRKLSSGEIRLLEALTDQIAVAIENSELYEKLKQNLEELRQKTADLERANKVKDEFLSVMSHELRTPLNVVMGYAGMLKDRMLGEISPEQERALAKVVSRSKELLTMISGILEATRIEVEEVKGERDRVKLGEFLQELESTYALPLDKELPILWDYPRDLPAVETDKGKLRHILENLINNAIKFTEKGSVTISARIKQDEKRPAEGHAGQAIGTREQAPEALMPGARLLPQAASARFVEFKVADTGIGIAQEFFPVIFEKFRQVDSSETRPYGGTGMGLYIVKKFTELLGGRVAVESELGKGSTFTVTIPCESSAAGVGGEEREQTPDNVFVNQPSHSYGSSDED